MSGSGISWAICKSAPHSRQITMPAPHHSVFYRPDAIPAAQPTASKHWRYPCSILLHTKSPSHFQCIHVKNIVFSSVAFAWTKYQYMHSLAFYSPFLQGGGLMRHVAFELYLSSWGCCFWPKAGWYFEVLCYVFLCHIWRSYSCYTNRWGSQSRVR